MVNHPFWWTTDVLQWSCPQTDLVNKLRPRWVFWDCICHDDATKWKNFPRYWPFVRGIHRWIPPQRPVTRSFDVFFDLHLNKQLSEQSWDWLFETPPRSLWRHCNGVWLCCATPLTDTDYWALPGFVWHRVWGNCILFNYSIGDDQMNM